MKKNILALLIVGSLATSSASASWIDLPISKTKAALGSLAIGAGVSVGATAYFTAFLIASKGIEAIYRDDSKITTKDLMNPVIDYSKFFFGTVFTITSYLTWKLFRPYTASGYFERGKDIYEGTTCSNSELLLLAKLNVGAPKKTAELVVDLFSAQKNELAKAVGALEKLFQELSFADYCFKNAQKVLTDSRLDFAQGCRIVIARTIANIKEISLEIKSYEKYQQQYDDELKEMDVSAQRESAKATRSTATKLGIYLYEMLT